MTGAPQNGIWPLPSFYFQVLIGGQSVSFQEVSGLDTEAKVMEYRAGTSKAYSTVKMPGRVQTGYVTLSKGVFVNDNRFWDWYSQIELNKIGRETVTINLLDQSANPTMIWELSNAWPVKITGTDLKAEGNEVTVETIELAHEGLKIRNG